MNIYQGKGTTQGKIISTKRNNQANLEFCGFSCPIYCHFSGTVLILEKLIFFRATTSTRELRIRSSCFFRAAAFLKSTIFKTVTFFEGVIFQNSYFFTAKLLPSGNIWRIESSLEQLLFRTATFLEQRYLQKSYFFKAGTSAQPQLFQKICVLEKVNYSKKHCSALSTFFAELYFQCCYFFKRLYLLWQLTFQKNYFLQHTFFRKIIVSQLHFTFQSYTSYLLVCN